MSSSSTTRRIAIFFIRSTRCAVGAAHLCVGASSLTALLPLQVPISNFIDDMSERDLLDLLPLMQSLAEAEDVTTVIAETFLQGVTPIHGK